MRSTLMWCQRDERGCWIHFAAHPEVSRLYEAILPVFAVTVTEAGETPECYWG